MTGRRYAITKQASHCSQDTPSPRHTDDLSLKNSLRMRSSSGMRSEKNLHPAQLSQVKNQQRSLAGASRPGLRVPLKRSLPRIRRQHAAHSSSGQRTPGNVQRGTVARRPSAGLREAAGTDRIVAHDLRADRPPEPAEVPRVSEVPVAYHSSCGTSVIGHVASASLTRAATSAPQRRFERTCSVQHRGLQLAYA